jgi:type IV secretory pathway VirB3-like protein
MNVLNKVINNQYFIGIVTVGTVLYASLARPELPQGIAGIFEHPLTKIIFYALIVLLTTQNLQVAIVTAIAFYVLMSMLREQRIAEGFVDGLRSEGFFSQHSQRSQESEGFYTQASETSADEQKRQHHLAMASAQKTEGFYTQASVPSEDEIKRQHHLAKTEGFYGQMSCPTC